MKSIKVDLEPGYEGDGLLKFDFPALKHWEITADMSSRNWLGHHDEGAVFLDINNIDIDYSCYFKLDDGGFLDPVVFKVKVDMADSKYKFDNWFWEIFTYQTVEFAIVVLENSAWFTGEYLFSAVLGPVMDAWLNHYQVTKVFPNPLRGQDTVDTLGLDYKNTRDPLITDKHIQFYLFGEALYKGKGCADLSPHYADFD